MGGTGTGTTVSPSLFPLEFASIVTLEFAIQLNPASVSIPHLFTSFIKNRARFSKAINIWSAPLLNICSKVVRKTWYVFYTSLREVEIISQKFAPLLNFCSKVVRKPWYIFYTSLREVEIISNPFASFFI